VVVKVTRTAIPDVLVLEPEVISDERGFLLESWREEWLASLDLPIRFVQDNHSYSVQCTLRGLHYQLERPQGKLVRVVSGTVYDVAVDLRRSSPTFGRWVGDILTAQEHRQLWIPPGFAHGFYVLSQSADLLYKCTEYYLAPQDRTIRWDDPELAINWPLRQGCAPILSAKDASAPRLSDAPTYS
jgi:dTDP-4-dehydrorhamnose 3,5-epimerase